MPELPKKESMRPAPISPYAVSKLFGEEYSKMNSNLNGLNTLIFRYFNVFGPRQKPDSEYSGVISKLIKAISENKTLEIYGDGTQTRDFTYVSDIVKANIAAANTETKPGAILNVATSKQTDLNYMVNQLNILLKKDVKPEYKDFKKGDIKHSYADINAIKEILRWKPETSFEEGLQITMKDNIENTLN